MDLAAAWFISNTKTKNMNMIQLIYTNPQVMVEAREGGDPIGTNRNAVYDTAVHFPPFFILVMNRIFDQVGSLKEEYCHRTGIVHGNPLCRRHAYFGRTWVFA